ncbi:MAG: hypothetical protein Q9227_001371 [Pyrenula ochraceoflavens]
MLKTATEVDGRALPPTAGRSASPKAAPPRSKLRRALGSIKWYLQDQWFLLAVGLAIIIASQVQVPATHQRIKSTVVTYLCVSIIFLITGLTLPTRTLLQNYSKWKVHLFVQTQCFLMTSATIFGIVSACATNPSFMSPGLLIGLIFMSAVPTTISSNVVMTRQAHGNQALTVVESTLGNFLGPFLTPALVKLYISTGAWYTRVLPTSDSSSFTEIYRRVFMQLGLSLFLPLALGQAIQNLFPTRTSAIFKKTPNLTKLSSLSLIFILWSAYDQAFASHAFTAVPASNILFIVFLSIALFLLYLSICVVTAIPWLPKRDVIAAAYCVPAKTPAMGIPVVQTMFVGVGARLGSEIEIPMVVYQGLQLAGGSLMTVAFRRWVKGEEEEEEEEERRRRQDVEGRGGVEVEGDEKRECGEEKREG